MQDKIMNGLAVSQQIIEPLAPNRPLTPITWKSAPKDPHGYYDRNNYARGWNDAVAVAEAKITELEQRLRDITCHRDRLAEQLHHLNGVD